MFYTRLKRGTQYVVCREHWARFDFKDLQAHTVHVSRCEVDDYAHERIAKATLYEVIVETASGAQFFSERWFPTREKAQFYADHPDQIMWQLGNNLVFDSHETNSYP